MLLKRIKTGMWNVWQLKVTINSVIADVYFMVIKWFDKSVQEEFDRMLTLSLWLSQGVPLSLFPYLPWQLKCNKTNLFQDSVNLNNSANSSIFCVRKAYTYICHMYYSY